MKILINLFAFICVMMTITGTISASFELEDIPCPNPQTHQVLNCAWMYCAPLVNESVATYMETGQVENPLGGDTVSCIFTHCPIDLELFLKQYAICIDCLKEQIYRQGFDAIEYCSNPHSEEIEYEYQET